MARSRASKKSTWAYAGICASLIASATMADTRGLIEQALDEPAAITLDRIRLGDAIEAVSKQTGVTIRMASDAMRFVPHGADMLIERVQIAHVPLRQGLTELFSPLGMTFVVRDTYVEIVPKEALRCLSRPPTWKELDTLAALSATQPGVDADALASLRVRVQFLVPMRDAWAVLSEAIRGVGAGPGDTVLSVACGNLGWAWCLSDDRIVIESREQQIRRQLQQPVSIRLNSRPLFDVLQTLGEQVNVPVRAEPGAVAMLPLHIQKNFSVTVHEQPAEQVIEAICAETGLGYLIEPDGVLLYAPGGAVVGAAQPSQAPANISMADPYIGTVDVPLGDGRSMRWLIRQSELPDDLRQMRERDIQAVIDALRQQSAPPQP